MMAQDRSLTSLACSFEVYERSKGDAKELSVRLSLSEGAHSAVLDASLDAKHALQVQPRRALTGEDSFRDAGRVLLARADLNCSSRLP